MTTDREQLAELFWGFAPYRREQLADLVLPWLAEHDRRVAARALHDAADMQDAASPQNWAGTPPGNWLRVLAYDIEAEVVA